MALTRRLRSLVQATEDPEILVYVVTHLTPDSPVFTRIIEDIRQLALTRLVLEWGPGTPAPALKEILRQRQTEIEAEKMLFQAEMLRVLRQASQDAPDLVRARLRDDNPLFRRVAIQVIASRRLPLEKELIERLDDRDVSVRQAARQALVLLGRGTDFGPVAKAGKAERAKAIEKWTAWLALQRPAAPASLLQSIAADLGEEPPPPPAGGVEDARVAELCDLLVKASGPQQEEVLRRLRTADGEHHTEALAQAIPQLSRQVQERARQALAERLARLPTPALRDRLQDQAVEIRRAAAKACSLKKATDLVPELRRLLQDADAAVADAARTALDELQPARP